MEWLKWIQGKLVPRTGRIIKEDGSLFNEADYLNRQSLEAATAQSLLGRTYATTVLFTLTNGESRDIVMEIPVGVRVFMHSRSFVVFDSRVDTAVLVGPDPGYAAASTGVGYNLNEVLELTAGSTLVSTVAPTTGATLRRGSINAGAKKVTSVNTDIDAIPQYNSDHQPVFRYTNAVTGDAEIAATFIWAEVPESELV